MVGHLEGKFLLVVGVDAGGTGCEIGGGPDGKEQAGRRPCEKCETAPLNDFAKIVGTGDIVIESFVGQIVAGVAGGTEMADYIVGMMVYGHAEKEQRETGKEGDGMEPAVGTGLERQRRESAEKAVALKDCVATVETGPHENDREGHGVVAPKEEGENESAVEIVQFEQQKEHQGRHAAHLPCRACKINDKHDDEGGSFHQYPSGTVADGGSPAGVEEFAVAGIDVEQGNVDKDGNENQNKIKDVHVLGIRDYNRFYVLLLYGLAGGLGHDELFGLLPEPGGEVGLNPPTGNIGMGAAAEELQGAVGCKCVEGGLGPFGR